MKQGWDTKKSGGKITRPAEVIHFIPQPPQNDAVESFME